MHATDDLSLLETPLSLGPMIETARAHFDGTPLIVTPITLKPRFNAVGPDDQNEEWSTPPVDPRQSAEITATWTCRTWEALASAGVASMTWFEAFGPRGVADNNASETKVVELRPVADALRSKAQQL